LDLSLLRASRRADFICCFSLRAASFCRFLNVSDIESSSSIVLRAFQRQKRKEAVPWNRLFDTRNKPEFFYLDVGLLGV
jgi:hypothetical protein